MKIFRQLLLRSRVKMTDSRDYTAPVRVESTGVPKWRSGKMEEFGWGFKGYGLLPTSEKNTYVMNEPNMPEPITYVDVIKNIQKNLNLDPDLAGLRTKTVQKPEDYPPPIINEEFIELLKCAKIEFTEDFKERLHRSLCQTFLSLYQVNYEKVDKLVDMVVFPLWHEDVVKIVEFANSSNVILLPIGGSTNVTEATCHPNNDNDTRSVVVVDLCQMNRMMWIDETNMLACFEAGIAGRDLENILNSKGFTFGHEPDSFDYSTLGGYISTRASGMKRQKYGNIEEVVKDVKFVTSVGVLSKPNCPRTSTGPSIRDLIFGSEGTLGIITEAIVKIHYLPKVVDYGAIVFPTFEHGVKFMKEMSTTSAVPASLRLIDNVHFRISKCCIQKRTIFKKIIDELKEGYLWYIKGFDWFKISIATYKMEGDKEHVSIESRTIARIAKKYSGVLAGPNVGLTGYKVTFHIAYIRDFFARFGIIGDSIETSTNWTNVRQVIKAAEVFWSDQTKKEKDQGLLCYEMGYRISQIYPDGVCLYLYYSIAYDTVQASYRGFMRLRDLFLKTITDAGGAISHHHGIGKKCREKYLNSLSPIELTVLQATKRQLDPKNIFANGNLYLQILDSSDERKVVAKL